MKFSNDFEDSNDEVLLRIRNTWFPKEDDLPTYRHFLAAGSASALASGIFNPLDSLRVRWQIAPREVSSSIIVFSRSIIKQEGLWYGLWKPGIGVNMVGMSLTSGLRFGSYETIRNHLHQMQQQASETQASTFTRMSTMMVAGLLSGSAAYYVTTPFHLLKTRIQASGNARKSHLWFEVLTLIGQGKVSSLYKGAAPLTIRGSLFTAGQMMGYDGFKSTAKKHGYNDGSWLHALSSISSAFFASFLSAPADYVMTRTMNESGSMSLIHSMKLIYTEGGVLGFWKGWQISFLRLTPVLLTYSVTYEQLRLYLGLGYFTSTD